MATAESMSRVGPYVERLATNEYLQENLGDAVASLRAAYARASKRKAAAAQDKAFYRQLRQAAGSISEARAALLSGREKPKRSKKRILAVLVFGLGSAGLVALATSEELRNRILGCEMASGEEQAAAPGDPRPTVDPVEEG